MDLSLTPAQEMLKGAVRQFVDQEYPKETLLEIAAGMNPSMHDSWSTNWRTAPFNISCAGVNDKSINYSS
jgi:hypothetical protein